MDPRTFQFIVFCVFSVLCLVAGHTARSRRWLREDASRRIHLVTVVMFWSLASFLSLWKLPIRPQTLWLLAIEPVLVVVPALVMLPLATRLLKLGKNRAGVLAIAAGISNNGLTLGAYLCFTLLPGPAVVQRLNMSPGQVAAASDSALAYGVAIVSIMSVCAVLMLYPLARYCGPHHTGDEPLPTLIRKSLLDIRAMNLYAALAGVCLAIFEVPQPKIIGEAHILQVLIYVSAAGAYFGIGLRLHLNQVAQAIRPHLLLAGMKFVGVPLLTVLLLSLTAVTPYPPDPLAVSVFLVLSCMPTAIQTVITSNIFHLDARFATSVWMVSTIAFVVMPLPVLLYLLS